MLSWHSVGLIECMNELMVYLEDLVECHGIVLLCSDKRLLWEEVMLWDWSDPFLNMQEVSLTQISNILSMQY